MIHRLTRKRTGLSRVELLLTTMLGGTLVGLVLVGLGGCQGRAPVTMVAEKKENPPPTTVAQPTRPTAAPRDTAAKTGDFNPLSSITATAKRVECSNNLRQIGIASISFEADNNGLPSDKNSQNYQGWSFYSQLLNHLELSSLNPNNLATPPSGGQAKPYICPGRRPAKQAPGACDYGYVASKGNTSLAILDAPGNGVTITTVSNAAGTSNTALLSHYWLAPTSYGSAKSPSARWAEAGSGYAIDYDKGSRGYDDNDAAGAASMGGPHPNAAMPCLFVDGHVGILSYQYPQFRELWDYSNATNKPRNNVP